MYLKLFIGHINPNHLEESEHLQLCPREGTGGQSMAIFIAILCLVPLSSGFSLIVVLVLNIEGEFVPFIDDIVLTVEEFGLFF